MPIIEVELKSGTYPASTEDTRVARCYVCNDIADKKVMFCIGPGVSTPLVEEGLVYIFRCKDCGAGSEKWLKHIMHRSTLRSLYMNLEGRKLNSEEQKALGGKIVEKTKEKYEREICDRLDKKKVGRSSVQTDCGEVATTATTDEKPERQVTASTEVEGGLSDRRRKRSWRTVTIRRGR